MQLVGDLLDRQVVDREGRNMGRVDGVVIALDGDGPPRVVAIEIGPCVLARRMPRWMGRWIERLAAIAGRDAARPTRIPLEQVYDPGIDLMADVDAEQSGVMRSEDWLREHVIGHIPGAGR